MIFGKGTRGECGIRKRDKGESVIFGKGTRGECDIRKMDKGRV